MAGTLLDMCCDEKCHTRCAHNNAAATSIVRHTLCTDTPTSGVRTRYVYATDKSALRAAVHELHRGVCAVCGLDCDGLMRRLRGLPTASCHDALRLAILCEVDTRFQLPQHARRRDVLLSRLHDGCAPAALRCAARRLFCENTHAALTRPM